MPSHLSADRPFAQPPGRGSVEALISQTRRLRGEVDAARRAAHRDGTHPENRWQRALYDLTLHQLDDVKGYLAQLRDGPRPPTAVPPPTRGPLLSRVGSAEWNLLTGEASCSGELYEILGRDPAAPAPTLDELPSLALAEDRPGLTAMVTSCLVDAKPIDGEFRVARPDGAVRTVHMMGEPVLDADGGTASMWAVLRDVSELRLSRWTVSETHDALQDHRRPHPGPSSLDLAARFLPPTTSAPPGGDWYDALELPDGEILFGVGDLTGPGVSTASGTATLLGALRGMAMAGTEPGQLLCWLYQLLDITGPPPRGGTVCCRYRPATRTLLWAQAGHPAPLLFRDGTGRLLDAPERGTSTLAAYGQHEVTLVPNDVLVLHTGTAEASRLIGMAERFTSSGTAHDVVRAVVEEFGTAEPQDGACVLVAKVPPG
ncbi:PP2C family protein-serine/threonine phosphatase [Streptomyces sp. NPDC086787]|uniref:PP2C family protein-serine/threonine phosphatase n=1 Tax=Streptomyces sp. NPDC086787 TaxID=3365759 RepID=UPI003806C6B7